MLRLERGADSLVILPEAGGCILGWTRDGVDLLRHPSPEAVIEMRPGAMGCFPLVPYCNRIGFRRFTWMGQSYDLAANFGDHPHAIHGVGWKAVWRILEAGPDHAVLFLSHAADGEGARAWPFAFDATLSYRLNDDGLTISLSATNRHSGPAPMGLGVHPFFPRARDAGLTFQAGGVWITRDALPVQHVSVPSAWDHTSGRLVSNETLDHCFTGWTGIARLPGLTIEADAVFADLQVFTPANADFFCVEPVSHPPDPFARNDIAALEPGETLSGHIRFTPV
jgi:aldose 1-epimerase